MWMLVIAQVPFAARTPSAARTRDQLVTPLQCTVTMAHADIPTLQEITQLTHSELTLSQDGDDIIDCGRACLALLPDDPETCLEVAYQHLHDVPYKDVKRCWRRLYVDAALSVALGVLKGQLEGWSGRGKEGEDEEKRCVRDRDGEVDWVTKVVKILDMALILTGAPAREELVELWFSALGGALARDADEARPAKRRKLDLDTQNDLLQTPSCTIAPPPSTFPTTLTTPPTLKHPIPRTLHPSLSAFQTKISNPPTQTPFIIEGAIEHWPALHERPWNRPAYLLEKTLGGRRLVPVEIGRSYTDEGWGQKILSFGEFVGRYMGGEEMNENEDNAQHTSDPCDLKPQTGYLAQHDLFAQIPSLRADISIPDYCYASPPALPPSPPTTTTTTTSKPVPILEEPLLNAWFGPTSTISPLHTDPYHNILAQVVGHKYVRLYAPRETPKLYPRGVDENGIDMSNTSEVDLDVAMRVWPEISCWEGDGGSGGERDVGSTAREEDAEEEMPTWAERYAGFKDARYVEGVLGPGECLYVPVGWWHYVRSVTPSFSVSFWFN